MAADVRAEDAAGIPYPLFHVWYWDCKDQDFHKRVMCEKLDARDTKLKNNTWYAVNKSLTIDHTLEIEKEGDVAHIIIYDGATLEVKGSPGRPAIDVPHGGTLHIYSQFLQSGTLIARGGVNGAGIGVQMDFPERIDEEYGGRLEFHGGRVFAYGGNCGAGIGGSRGSFGNSVIIYGGEVTAEGGGWAAGIGAGAYAGRGHVGGWWVDDLQRGSTRLTIRPGAKVTAKGGQYGAGIGGSHRGSDGCGGLREGYIRLEGCTVWAEGGEGAAGIGGGKGGAEGGCDIYYRDADISAFGGVGCNGIGSGDGWADPLDIEFRVFNAIGCEVREGPQPPGAPTYIRKDGDYFHGMSQARFTRIRTLSQEPPKPPVTYWNGEKGREETCSKYDLIGGGTQVLNAYGWFVVRGHVKMTDHGLWCGGPDVHIILTDGSRLEIEAPDNAPGIEVVRDRSTLHIHPEHKDGTGTMVAVGGLNGAGIGGRVDAQEEWLSSGALTIHGGRITCTGGGYAAGIGGSNNGGGTGGGIGGGLTIYGGEVTAIGGWAAAGAGGAAFGWRGGPIYIAGGSLRAYGGFSRQGQLPGIGSGIRRTSDRTDINTPDGRRNDFVIWEGDEESGTCRLVKNDSYFSVGMNACVCILAGRTERVSYLDKNGAVREAWAEVLVSGETPANPADTTSDRWFVVEDDTAFAQTLTLPGKTANLILPDGSLLSVASGSSGSPALKARALNVFGQERGTGMLEARGGSGASGISTDGSFELYGGRIVASGARDGLTGGSLTVEGGRLAVSCQQTGLVSSGAVAIRGGTVAVTDGTTHVQAGSLTVSGGNLLVERNRLAGGAMPPKNAEGKPLFRLTVVLPDWFGGDDGETAVRITDWEGPTSYGLDGLYPIDGRLYLWLPNGTYKFNVDCGGLKIPYEVKISDGDAVVNPGDEVFDLAVNGVRIQTGKSGAGWNYRDGVLHLTGENGTFVISGSSTRGEVQVLVEANMTVVLSNATVVTSRRAAMRLADNVKATVRTVDGVSILSASGDRNAATGAGIEVNGLHSAITIDGDGTSTLYATGGWGSAGIGGTSRDGFNSRHCGGIDIRSGNVIAIGGENGAGIGGGREGVLFADIVLECGATVTATGGWGAAGIGGGLGSWARLGDGRDFTSGTIRLAGAVVSAGGGLGAAGIGGGRYIQWKKRKWKHPKRRRGQAPQVEVGSGTIIVTGGASGAKEDDGTADGSEPNWNACADIGIGENGQYNRDAGVRILGGTIVAARDRIDPVPVARNSPFPARRVSVVDAGLIDGQPVSLVMNEALKYGTNNVHSVDGQIHLYLPDRSGKDKFPTTHCFLVNDIPYVAKLNGSNTVAERCKEPWDCTVSVAASAPHVSGFAVSNNFGRIDGIPVEDHMDYHVKAYDDVTVDFTVEEGYVREGGTRICIPGIVDDVTIGTAKLEVHPFVFDADGSYALVSHGAEWIDLGYRGTATTRVECASRPAIEVRPGMDWSRFLAGVATALNALKIYEGNTLVMDLVPFGTSDGSAIFGLYDKVTKKPFTNRGGGAFEIDEWMPGVPYRAWNGATRRMEDRTCLDYTVVTANTATLDGGRWYVVTGEVSRGTITVGGSAHLILCDGAKLALNGSRAGLAVPEGSALSIYGQALGTGELAAQGGSRWSAGIGGTSAGRKRSGACGAVTIDGGRVTARGGRYGAGIGGHWGAGGAVTINGGRVTAFGGRYAAGIGNGYRGVGGTVTINGGTVTATGGSGAGIGRGRKSRADIKLTIDGGSVAAKVARGLAKNSTPTNVYCVTAKCPFVSQSAADRPLALEGLGSYGTNDIYAVDGKVCLWLPDGTHHFAFSDGTTTCRYCAVVKGRGITVEPLGPVGFFVNGEDVGDDGVGDGWYYQDRVLTLDSPLTYVLSGEATNNEVQVKTDAYGAKIVLSNAVVFTDGRPALVAVARPSVLAQKAELQMAGGTSYLAATNGSAAISVAPAVTLTVDLAQGADRKEAMIGVFNYGPAKAIAGTGRVKVNGGTFFVWADEQAVETPDEFACGAKEAMMTGETPETLRYVEDCDGKACVLVGPGVTVTVKDIPHVTDVVVSNWTETISGAAIVGGTAYRVMLGDDVFVGYALEKGYFSRAENPLVYPEIEDDITIDANTIPVLQEIPYRAWNPATQRMEVCVCTNYTVITADTATLGADRWYVVTGMVARGSITVGGSAHLILCDGAKLTVDEISGVALAVYGQPSGCGELKVSGTAADSLVCEGGFLSAGTIAGDSLAVIGGTLEADAVNSVRKTIAGGSVKAAQIGGSQPVNQTDQPLYCVTVKCEGLKVEKLRVEGLGDYVTNDIYPIGGRVYLWLPDGTHGFTLSDGTTTYRYCAVVKGRAITVEPLGPVGFFVNGKDVGNGSAPEDGWIYLDSVLTLESAKTYVLSGSATNDEVQVKVTQAGATVVLSNAVVFASGRTAFDVAQSTAFQMAGCASFLAATNNAAAVSVGPNAALAVALAPGANRNEAMIGVFNFGDLSAIAGAGSVAMNGGTLAVWADKRASELPLMRTADVFCMVAGSTPETAKVVDEYRGEPYVFVTASVAPVTPGTPIGPFATAVTATNVAQVAVVNPRDDVAAVLGFDEAIMTYCDMFGFAVTGGDTAWSVEAVLTPEAWTNVALSAQAATRQIPLADIAALPLGTPTNVTAKGCGMPGFYYSFYEGGAVTNVRAVADGKGRNVLCGMDGDMEFSGVVKPSDAAGLFSIGAKEAPGVQPSDRAELEPPARISSSE